jgi:glutathione S-transferase
MDISRIVFRPRTGEPADEEEVQRGLTASARVLDAIENLFTGSQFLVGPRLSLCDIRLASMIAYFAMTVEGVATLYDHKRPPDFGIRRRYG